ncbi:hypothetical protein SCLO_1023510 [Sphingobium cloacae]|uniref:Uncharacterized protein n=2 Tax=Sphingobium cloacae TaxID=120107 RepID=A0A1E1F4N2_9SPHN|nr:hypothetical protein [Sphingobium cloacae]BAV65391.1 hypothetical protein SCLO_1023510 [Sphingobium cloacae]
MVLPVMPSLPDLTEDERAAIRQACGFACVRCGVTIYRYLGLPEGRGETLMCPTCHGLVEEGRLTPAQVQNFHANPVVRQRHFARDRLPFSSDLPHLVIGGSRLLRDTPIPLTLDGEPILIFAPPRRGNGATRISLRMGAPDGTPVQVVDGNEWLPRDGSWHFLQRGDRYSMMAARGDGIAILRIVSRNRIAVEHLRTTIRGRRLEATPDWLAIDGQRHVGRIASGTLIGLEC